MSLSDTLFARLDCEPYAVQVEYQWINAERIDAPLAVFLHEGLGSIALWRDWPQSLCDHLGCRGVVYSRPGYGRSTPRRQDEQWPVEFLHRQACDVLPALLDALHVGDADRARMWLIGHSDGGTIALLYASAFPDALAGIAIMAPHVFVEEMTTQAIARVRTQYESTAMREKLKAYHDDVDSAFYGWNDAWLQPAFRDWNITHEVASIKRPLLAMQGHDDEYASMAQLDRIKASAPQTHLLKLEDCRHSPHRDAPAQVNEAIARFIASNA